ncbi:hypothetical protein [Actinomycetospora sp. CA-084318]|uniref:hypothetical protein n=1 Tax=Actinomycetospora sp. CA-084318 TaxID=3239892 RepID=UPI003D96727D
MGALVGFVVLALALIAGTAFPSAITVEGSFRHTDSSSMLTPGASCYTRMYTAGTRVDVTDDTGAVVATGTLDEGIAMVDSDSTYGRLGYATECAFAFTVDNVPSGSRSYGIEIAGVPNRLAFSEQEMRNGPGLHNGS